MFARPGDDEHIARAEFPRVLPDDMQGGTASDDHQFGELMGMRLEGFLWFPSLDADREPVGMKPLVDS
jgi:hypothetical protein